MLVPLTCTPRARTSLQKGPKGHQWWRKDAFHVAAGARTLCGVEASDWLALDPRERADVLSDTHLCSRCAAKLGTRSCEGPEAVEACSKTGDFGWLDPIHRHFRRRFRLEDGVPADFARSRSAAFRKALASSRSSRASYADDAEIVAEIDAEISVLATRLKREVGRLPSRKATSN